MPNSDPSPESHVSNSQIGRVIEQALDEIPDDFRTVFVLREVEGMSTSEVAEVLEIAEGTVKTRLFRGKQRLRALLEGRIDGALTEVHEFAGARCDRITRNVMGAIVRRVP